MYGVYSRSYCVLDVLNKRGSEAQKDTFNPQAENPDCPWTQESPASASQVVFISFLFVFVFVF